VFFINTKGKGKTLAFRLFTKQHAMVKNTDLLRVKPFIQSRQ